MQERYRLRLLGPVQFERADQPRRTIDSRKSLALLAYLSRHTQPIARQQLADLLWGDTSEARGRRNLSRELSEITAQFPGCFQADYHTVQWAAANAWVDTAAFQALLAEPLQAQERGASNSPVRPPPADAWFARHERSDMNPDRLAEAVALYHGEFMAGFYLDGCPEFESWLVRERELWQRLVTEALERLITYYALDRHYDQALCYARRWLELEPWQEEAHRYLIALLARSGRRSDALAQYETCQRALAAELGVEPSSATIALYDQIRSGRFDVVLSRQTTAEGESQEHEPVSASRDGVIAVAPAQEWGATPEVECFYGRQNELATLERWLADEHGRVVAILGMGGIGKTVLAAHLARRLAHHYDAVIWRSLLNAPPLAETLRVCIPSFSAQEVTDPPKQLDDQLALLLDLFRRRRCLLVLDNCESILQAGARAGAYRPGYEDYGQLIRRVGEHAHRSCLLLTSREQPQGFELLQSDTALVGSLHLAGLNPAAGQQILQARGLTATMERTAALIARYSGNPLALQIVAETVKDLFDGDLTAFLREETLIFDDIRDILDQQWRRLTALERDILFWLAVEREAVGIKELRTNLVGEVAGPALLEALRSLQRRSLIEQQGAGFTLQNVVTEYVTDRLIDQICEELTVGEWKCFRSHALIKAQAKEYVRESQLRLILEPIAERVVARLDRSDLERALQAGLARLQAGNPHASGYAAGNAINLLLHLGYDLRGYDFSRLNIWQADLRGARLQDLNVAYADLSGSSFTGLLRTVDPAVWSSDGQLIAAPSTDGEIRLWRVSDWQLVGLCVGHGPLVRALAFSPDGQLLASGGDDQTVRVWDVGLRQTLLILRGHTRAVSSLAWSPDGATLFSGSWDQTVRVWDAASGQALSTLEGHTEEVTCVDVSRTGQLASASLDRTVRLWDVPSGQTIRVLTHPAQVFAAVWSPDGMTLASGGSDEVIRLWDARSWTLRGRLEGATNRIRRLAFSPDGARLASGGDTLVRLWDLGTGQPQIALYGHTNSVVAVAWSRDGTRLVSQGDETIRMWDISTGQCLSTLYSYADAVLGVAFSPDGSVVASRHADQNVRLWDTARWQMHRELGGHSGWITGLSFSPDGGRLASSCYDPAIRIWDVRTGQQLGALRSLSDRIYALASSPDGTILASGGKDNSIWLWDVQQRRVIYVIRGFDLAVSALAFSPDGMLLASGGEDALVCLWDTKTWEALRTYRGHSSTVYQLTFNRTGTTLISASEDATVRIWEALSGKLLRILQGHTGPVYALALSPDGATLASGGVDQTLRLWDADSGAPLGSLPHTSWVNAAAFSPDGASLLSGCHDGTLRLWDTQSGQCLRVLRAPGPYAGMNIAGVTGVSEAQKVALKALGAVE